MRRFVALELGASIREKAEEGVRLGYGRAQKESAGEPQLNREQSQRRAAKIAEERREEERINFCESDRDEEVGRQQYRQEWGK